ncbi:thymidine phosphorylase family protein [Tahibacter amnicola]|uniref:Putative thymidine phosphorylase n=1 Tax=Tahibacter amnicola TaxID=2976241 RepID=A0ABY6BBP3_9GAMM|nr:thymidine phosphorylase family protein [Tahibacter amnicola]UXI66056.1 thymidine phosphorylase family protein [Tahibacter amnicola]
MRLRLRRMGVDTYQESVVYMHRNCVVCRSEGFEAQSRIVVEGNGRRIVATLNVVTDDWISMDSAGLSEAGWRRLNAPEGTWLRFSHPAPAESASDLRAKVYGQTLDVGQYERLLRDAIAGRLADIELAAFVTACAGDRLGLEENIALTRAMINVGERLQWPRTPVLDKHCVGGLPGNRTTPIVVAIVAAAGYLIPKTSSRAITSPAGTADTMETLAPVELGLAAMRRVVEREGGCIVWGGAVGLSPADDVLIRVERPLDFDSDAQLTASVLSKKVAAGATHVVLDLPVGPTAKVRSAETAASLGRLLSAVAQALGLVVDIHLSDGRQPVGRGVGPALEALDVLKVLRNAADAPQDLRERALELAGRVLDFVPGADGRSGSQRARALLESGAAERKFIAICEAQGGFRQPSAAPHRTVFAAPSDGVVAAIDNRRLSRLAKLAGAPRAPAAGLEIHVRLDQRVGAGEPLLTLHAQTSGELAYANEYLAQHSDIVKLGAAS